MLLLLGVPMGAIAGVAIGLFFSPSANPVSLDAGSPAGNLTLTASGLGFLAGYGAEAVFRFLDTLLRLVLPERPVTETTQQRPASHPSTSAAVPAAPAVPPQSAPAV
jgi:hypothetical protein